MPEARLEQRLKLRDRPNRSPLMFQTWTNLLFAHWEVTPEVIQQTLPAGLTVDTWEGRAFVGVVPFFIRGLRPRAVPCLPWISNCLEVNIRTYVVDAEGNPGVWFYSLDCNQPFAVWFARAMFSLPYQHAKMSARFNAEGSLDYRSQRRRTPCMARFAYAIESEVTFAEPGSFEFFLIERYLLFTAHGSKLYRVQVHHRPYPLSAASLRSFSIQHVEPSAVNTGTPPMHLIGSSGVNVEIFPAQAI
jgi:uncharacterized protein YqjF (DUF2071 family)